jgi:hypothetical protein
MPKTAVGLFEDPSVVGDVMREIETLGLPRNEVRVLDEPATFPVSGVMSFGRLDFEVDVARELMRIGASKAQAEEYVKGLRRGGALVFATGSDEKADLAADVMNRRGAMEIEETDGPKPHLPGARREAPTVTTETSVMTGRIRQSEGGASVFVW